MKINLLAQGQCIIVPSMCGYEAGMCVSLSSGLGYRTNNASARDVWVQEERFIGNAHTCWAERRKRPLEKSVVTERRGTGCLMIRELKGESRERDDACGVRLPIGGQSEGSNSKGISGAIFQQNFNYSNRQRAVVCSPLDYYRVS